MKKTYYITSDFNGHVFNVETDENEENIISVDELGYYDERWDDYDKEPFPEFDVEATDDTTPGLSEKEQKIISYLIRNY